MVSAPATGANQASSTTTRANGAHTNGTTNGQRALDIAPQNAHNANAPLSARHAAPLDLSTVERRGQANAPREPQKSKARPHGLQEAPTYRPTEEEWKEPMEYMRKIAPEGAKYGICKIIPPEDWNPTFAIDTERFHFRTRKQELNSVEGGTRANLNYLDQLSKFHKQHGTTLTRFPSVDKRPLDLYKLKKAVEVRGGFEQVCKLKKWAEIGRDLGYSGKIMSSLSTSLKNSYQRWLHPYEEYLRVAKPGVQHQLDTENGGPFTPSPGRSPAKKNGTPNDVGAGSPAVRASTALNGALTNGDSEKTAPPENRSAPSGFTAINGFSAINSPAPGGFTAVNGTPVKQEQDGSNAINSRIASAKNTPEPKANSPMPNGHSNPLKRAVSHESLNGNDANGDKDGGEGGRRSKRLRQSGPPTVAGSHMSLLRPSPQRTKSGKTNSARRYGDKCDICAGSADRPSILVCDDCELGFHMACLDPPLTAIPDYDWVCPKCLVGTGEYGFEEGGIYSLKQFQEKANNFKDNHFGSRMQFDPVLNKRRCETEDDVEREFWRLVESLTETVEVDYGADIHSTTHGSGFPTVERQPLDKYSHDPWNLNVLPLHKDSLFRHIKGDISGMTVPWLYVGMCFSTFCWHNEDHYTYSANYQHFGATKTWYGIPGADAEAFEEAMRRAVPELFESQPDLLFQLVTLLPPDQLKKAGVNVYALDQRAGQMVITFPQAYHAGFNHGFNFNEAVNFAPADWEPFGEAGVSRLQAFRRHPCFSHDELLLTAASRDTSIKSARWLAPALERMRDRELSQRAALLARHKEVAPPHSCNAGQPNEETVDESMTDGACGLDYVVEEEDLPEDDYQCAYCKAYAYLGQFICHNSNRTICLMHADSYDCCDEDVATKLTTDSHTLRLRFGDEALKTLVSKVTERARIPQAWEEKLDALLEGEPRPPLKSLHSLVTEGEKIPFFLPKLQDLKEFVAQCDAWVEKANNYITRKQQNRRKNDKAWRKSISGKQSAHFDDKKEETRTVAGMLELLKEAGDFDCPQIVTLQERADEIAEFQKEALCVLQMLTPKNTEEINELIERGKGFSLEMEEIANLERELERRTWFEEFAKSRDEYISLPSCEQLLARARELSIPAERQEVLHLQHRLNAGLHWDQRIRDVLTNENVPVQQLEALANGAGNCPLSDEVYQKMNSILEKQRESERRIRTALNASKNPDMRNRPSYTEIKEIMDPLANANSKPTGYADLEHVQRLHEDWIRKGKKLFGKSNAPLHILKAHMTTVDTRNRRCFDLEDRARPPVEPSSRSATPEGEEGLGDEPRNSGANAGSGQKDVFCLCRQPEAGMMIECEICHEWYHGKCLKIARGRIKDDPYTCPICDWRGKIPRDAARPRLEDLIAWQAEIPGLPFRPEEEELLASIVDAASRFREFLRAYTNPISLTHEEVSQMIFYLRKVEGADVLLADETNVFRQQIHKFNQVAPEPPPITEVSLSTRKPRPTKLEKLMQKHGVDNAADLPAEYQPLKAKLEKEKRKSLEPGIGGGSGGPGSLHSSAGGSSKPPSVHSGTPHGPGNGGPSPTSETNSTTTPRTLPHQMSTGDVPHFTLPEQPSFTPPVSGPPGMLNPFNPPLSGGIESRAFVPGSFMQHSSFHGHGGPAGFGVGVAGPTSMREGIHLPASISMNTHGLEVTAGADLFAQHGHSHSRNEPEEPEIRDFDLLANLSDDEDEEPAESGTKDTVEAATDKPEVTSTGLNMSSSPTTSPMKLRGGGKGSAVDGPPMSPTASWPIEDEMGSGKPEGYIHESHDSEDVLGLMD